MRAAPRGEENRQRKGGEHFAVGLFDGSAVVVVVVVATTLTSVLRLTFAVSHFCNNSTTSLALPLSPQQHCLLSVFVRNRVES